MLFTLADSFLEDLAHGQHDFSRDPLKLLLSNTEPAKEAQTKEDIKEIAPGNGYDAGGKQVTVVSSGRKSGLYRLVLETVTFAASHGSFGPYRYAVLYNERSHRLIGWYDYQSSLSTHHSDTFAVQFDGENGVLQLG